MKKITDPILSFLMVMLLTSPAFAAGDRYAVFRKINGKTQTESCEIWVGKQPQHGTNIPEDCIVIKLERGQDPRKFVRNGMKLEPKPPQAIPELTDEQKADREVRETLNTAAADATITDEQYAKLVRISNIEDAAKKKQEWDKIKNEVKK